MAIEALAPAVRAAAADIAGARRLPDAICGALRSSGIHRLLVPRELGGFAAQPETLVAAVTTLAAADGSAGWCAAIGAGSNFFAGLMPEAGARRVFADPDAPGASMFSPSGRIEQDGEALFLSGRWPFTSNCLHATTIAFGATFPTRASGLVFVSQSSVEIHDTWHAAGLRGTGSHDCSVKRLRFDPQHTCGFFDAPWADSPLWRLPTFTALGPVMAAVPLGMARGAMDELLQKLREPSASGRGLVDDDHALAIIAECTAAVDAAEASLLAACRRAWEAVERGAVVDSPLRARVFMACHSALDTAVAVASTAHRLTGGAGAYEGNRLLGILQDTHTVRQHVFFSHRHRPSAARALAGLPVSAAPFF
jgi:indole-3-acetate monooxygenase